MDIDIEKTPYATDIFLEEKSKRAAQQLKLDATEHQRYKAKLLGGLFLLIILAIEYIYGLDAGSASVGVFIVIGPLISIEIGLLVFLSGLVSCILGVNHPPDNLLASETAGYMLPIMFAFICYEVNYLNNYKGINTFELEHCGKGLYKEINSWLAFDVISRYCDKVRAQKRDLFVCEYNAMRAWVDKNDYEQEYKKFIGENVNAIS